MVSIPRLTDEEKYLLAILTSQDGIDLGEAFLRDAKQNGEPYRLRDYQWDWFANKSKRQISQSSRKVGKSESIKLRAVAMPFALPGRGMLVTAPSDNHLKLITSAINDILLNNRVLREMLPNGKSAGINLRPHFEVRFKNGATIVSRLPLLDGRGVKGNHVTCIELDEAQDYPPAGWVEISPTFNAGDPEAVFRVHGVSTGARDSFWEKSQPGSGWHVHRIMAMMRPDWSDEQRQANITEFRGTRQDIDYRRNIYGDHGDASSPLFVAHKLLLVTDNSAGSVYNTDVYRLIRISDERFPESVSEEDRIALIESWVNVPDSHLEGYSSRAGGREIGSPRGYSRYYAGLDVGLTAAPSELLIYGKRTASEFLELLLRINMERVNSEDQKQVIRRCFTIYGEKLHLGIDRNGVGFPIYDSMARENPHIYGFHETALVIAGVEERPLEPGEKPEDLIKKRPFIEAATDWLRNNHVDARQLRLPQDNEVLRQFRGQTTSTVKGSGPYGIKRQFNGAGLHTLDATRYAIGAMYIPALEEMLAHKPERAPVIPVFMGQW